MDHIGRHLLHKNPPPLPFYAQKFPTPLPFFIHKNTPPSLPFFIHKNIPLPFLCTKISDSPHFLPSPLKLITGPLCTSILGLCSVVQ